MSLSTVSALLETCAQKFVVSLQAVRDERVRGRPVNRVRGVAGFAYIPLDARSGQAAGIDFQVGHPAGGDGGRARLAVDGRRDGVVV